MWFLRTFGGTVIGLFLFWTLYLLNLWLDFIPKYEPYDYSYETYTSPAYDDYGVTSSYNMPHEAAYDPYSDGKMEEAYPYDEPDGYNEEMAPAAPGSSSVREALAGFDAEIGEDYSGQVYQLTIRSLVFNEDMPKIAQATALEELTLEQPGYITDDGLRHLTGLTRLRYLSLQNAGITDSGLYYLEGLTNLSTVDLTGTGVTFDGVSRLRSALPGCNVIY